MVQPALRSGALWSSLRNLSAAQWAAANPVLAIGEAGLENDTGIVRVGDGASAFLALSSGVRTAKQTAQVTNNDAANFVDITGLAFSVQNGHRYHVQFYVVYQSDATTTGVTWNCGGPAMTSGIWTTRSQQAATGTGQFWFASPQTFGATTGASASVVATGTNYSALMEGVFQPSADGTIQLKVRSEVQGSTITVPNVGIGIITDAG